MSKKPGYSTSNGEGPEGPRSSIELHSEAVKPTVDDEDLESSNYGLGNYSSREFYQQVETFVEGMYADSAFSRIIFERAVYETKRALAADWWESLEPADRRDLASDGGEAITREEFVREHADEAWASLEARDPELSEEEREYLTTTRRLRALQEHAGISRDWTPPQLRAMNFKHEASRSRGARLMDNVFGRVQRVEHDRTGGEEIQRRLGGN